MWKIGYGVLPTTIALFAIFLICLTGNSNGTPVMYSVSDPAYDQLAALIKFMEKVKTQTQPKQISGQVSLRSPRSDFVGDMAHQFRLINQLQELDRMYGSKSRPRFGKRNGMNQNDPSIYGYYDAINNANLIDEDGSRR